MSDLNIDLSDVSLHEFYGEKDKNLKHICNYFPGLKIIARGNQLKASGDDQLLGNFQRKIQFLKEYLRNYQHLDESIIEKIILLEKIPFERSESVLVHGPQGRLVRAKTYGQVQLVEEAKEKDLIFAVGPAGTGKTYTSVALAVQALKSKQLRRIILTRPAVEAGENLGFLPGDLKEKLDPYLQPLYDALREMIPPEKLTDLIDKRTIEIAPLAFMRGRTLNDAFVILDEAQNATHAQMKMFLTRMGQNAKFIITGDPSQVDLPPRELSGLSEALNILKHVKGISFVFLKESDVIRHPLVKKVIKAYG